MPYLTQLKKKFGWVRWNVEEHPTSCELCLKDFIPGSKNGWACWDHCHSCGRFRGWICALCNTAEPWRHRKVAANRGIQHLIRDPEWQERLDAYLKQHSCRPGPPLSEKNFQKLVEGSFLHLSARVWVPVEPQVSS